MIYENIRSHTDYKKKADELFMVGIYQLFDFKFEYIDFNFRYNQKIAICNSNLQQCCELYLKSLLCKKSPYLLIQDTTYKDLVNNIEKAHKIFITI